jgi:glutathione synthase/RimK-type ligase-like ATP-grasp enzyme
MAKIAILTPDPADEGFHTRWRDVLAELSAPLKARGHEVSGPNWTDAALGRFDLVLPLLAWGYHRAGGAWDGETHAWERQGVPVQNAPSVLRWNADKAYLGRLGSAGAPIIPTLFTDRLTLDELDKAARRFGTDRLIAKPRISAGAWQTIRWSPGAPISDGPSGPAMIQPYLSAIERSGEVSLIYLAGAFSHAIRKVPQPGDFRVQPEYQGIINAYDPAPDEHGAAEAALAAVEERLLFARVDLVRDAADRPLLMEMELVEPDLYLRYDPASATRFADAVEAALG